MRIFVFLVLWIAALGGLYSQSCKVEFRIVARVAATEKLTLAGGGRELGNWNPAQGLPLNRLNDSLWQASLQVKRGTVLDFKITRGSWPTEALTADGHVPGNYQLPVLHDTAVTFTVTRWKDQEPSAAPQSHGQVTGDLRYHQNMEYPGLLPRDVLVWLPPGYATDTARRYPVVYMLDAQNVFDPATSTLGFDWRVDEVCDSLIRAGKMQPVIVVGTTSTADRTPEYSYGSKSKIFAEFLIKSLKPMIESQYRTKSGPENTAIMGSSMGGLSAFVLAWEHPDVFGKAGCFSPAFKISRLDYVSKVKKKQLPNPLPELYIYNGTVGLEADLQPGIDDMMAVLRDKKVPFVWVQGQGEAHQEPAWARWVSQPLVQFFGIK